MSKKSFPQVIKRGSVAVKIYFTPNKGCDSYTLSYWQDRKRKRPTFKSFELAKAEAETVANRLTAGDLDVLELKSADRAAYLRARQLLDPLDIPIETAAALAVEIKKALGDVPPMQAVNYFLSRFPKNMVKKRVADVVEEIHAAKLADGLSLGYLRHLKYDLSKFSKEFKCNIAAVNGVEVDEWLRKLGVSPRTRNNLRISVQTLFNFAKARRYLPKDHDEIDSVPVAKAKGGEIEIFTPEEISDLLTHASDHHIPFLALGAFAGVRHAEILRLEWQDIHFDAGIIEIRAAKAKTASRRTIPLQNNLRTWLQPHAKKSGLICVYRNMAEELIELVKQTNKALKKQERVVKWKHNGLRHSYISYRVAETQNVAQVSLEAGNSPQMIFQHYRELVRPEAAKKWFAIEPAAKEKITQMPAAVAA